MTEKCTNCPTKRCIETRIRIGEYSVLGRLEMKYQYGKMVSSNQIGETIEECVARHEEEVKKLKNERKT